MLSDFSFRPELDRVSEQLQQEIRFKAAPFEELVALDLNELDRFVCPALVLAASKASGGINDKSIEIAKVIQFTFLADKVHNLLSDDEDLPEEKRQFPVLVGDFLYGKFFYGLAIADLLQYLNPLAQVIQEMSEAIILRWQNAKEPDSALSDAERVKIYEKQRGLLAGIGAKFGAELSGASLENAAQCEEFGRLLGIAWAAFQNGEAQPFIDNILNQARNTLVSNDSLNVEPLDEVLSFVCKHLGGLDE